MKLLKDSLILIFYKALFADKDVEYKGKVFPLKRVKGLRRYDIGNLLFIEQNKKSKTEWARRAREGRKIMWIIDTKWNKYLVRVEDNKITYLKDKEEKDS